VNNCDITANDSITDNCLSTIATTRFDPKFLKKPPSCAFEFTIIAIFIELSSAWLMLATTEISVLYFSLLSVMDGLIECLFDV
jgi:hypothetical protein